MEFKLPEIGEGVHEGELIKWLVKEGDSVAADQALLEVMTDKATVEVPSPSAGTIRGINSKEGDMIKVGSVLATIDASASASSPAASSKTEPHKTAPSNGNGTSSAPTSPAQTAQTAQAPQRSAAAAPPTTTTAISGGVAYQGALESFHADSVPAAPIVRAMAQKSGVDLAAVPASGPLVGDRRRVLEQDLLNFLNQPSTPATTNRPQAPATAAPSPSVQIPTRQIPTGAQEIERQPVRGLRRVIAQAMTKSKYTAPHYSYVDEFECGQLVELREEAKKIGEKMGVKITYLPFIIKAVVSALKEFPVVNSSLEESSNGMELLLKKYYNIGFAVATKDGLVVPVIKNADQKTIAEIAHEMTELSNKVRAGKASADDLKGSTFSITSMGNIGGLFATPIINYPEVGILGVYKVQEKPIVKNGQIVIGKTMHISLSLDHRVVDGAVGGYFSNAIIERLQNPARLLMDLV